MRCLDDFDRISSSFCQRGWPVGSTRFTRRAESDGTEFAGNSVDLYSFNN
jgi:hypothetical protein